MFKSFLTDEDVGGLGTGGVGIFYHGCLFAELLEDGPVGIKVERMGFGHCKVCPEGRVQSFGREEDRQEQLVAQMGVNGVPCLQVGLRLLRDAVRNGFA